MPPKVLPAYYARIVNQTLRTHYSVAQMREMLADEFESEDLELVVELRNVLLDRVRRSMKRPDFKKNPEGAMLALVLNELL